MAAFVLPIIDGARNFNGMTPAEAIAGTRRAQMIGFIPPTFDAIAMDAAPAVAYINHNQLIADCPHGCPVATFVWRDGPHLFMCPECFNGAIGYRWRLVKLPRDLDMIEAALLYRPLPQTRHWRAPETVADLLAENEEHLQ